MSRLTMDMTDQHQVTGDGDEDNPAKLRSVLTTRAAEISRGEVSDKGISEIAVEVLQSHNAL
jgi:hypothetical protein